MTVIDVAIQHHPARGDLLPPLLASLAPLAPRVVADPDPAAVGNPWRTYRGALDSTPDAADYVCILQDDVTVCQRFAEALAAAVASRPDRMLCLFHGGAPRENLPRIEQAAARGHAWARLDSRRWVPAVALVWPRRLVCEVVCWVEEQGYPRGFRADDEIIGRALRALGEAVLACVPSVVQHEDAVPSLVGQRARAGRDPARVAHRWIGGGDPLALDWNSGDDA